MNFLGPAFSEGFKGVGKFAGDKALKWTKGEGDLLDFHDYFDFREPGYVENKEAEWSRQNIAERNAEKIQKKRVEGNQPIIDEYLQQSQDEQVQRLRKLYLQQFGG